MAGKLFLSDLDDTCGGINWAYRKSIALAYALLVDEIRQKPPEIEPFFRAAREVSGELVKRRGQTRGVWGDTLLETYRYFCDEYGVAPRQETEAKVYEIGMAVYTADFHLFDRTREALLFLREQNDRVVIVTNCEEETQPIKMESADITDLVDSVYCTPHGKAETLKRLARDWAGETYGIGDNALTDGTPLKGFGRFLLVDHGPFADSRADGLELPPTRTIHNLGDIVDNYGMLQDPETWRPERMLEPLSELGFHR